MSRRGWIWLGAGTAILGLLVAVFVVVARSGSPREFVAQRYTPVSSEGGRNIYSSNQRASVVADEIARGYKPVDRLVDPAGHFLRYSRDYIAVLPAAGGGSTINVTDARTGHALWFPYVGGSWGSSGSGGGFRGGGPGAGK